MAIPVSHLQRFLARPEIVFTPPVVNRGNQHEPAEFRAKALALLPDTAALELELILHTGAGKERRFAMKPSGGSYLAEAVPVPELAGPQAFPVEVKYNDGSVKGMVEERNFRVGGETISLSQVRKLLPAVNASVQLHDGRTISGSVTDLDPILVRIGKQSFRLDLAKALQISVDSADHASGIYCTILARHVGREVGRFHAPLNVDGAQRPSLAVGSDGLKIEDKLTSDDPKDRSLQFSPHKVYQVRLKAGQKYTIDLVSTDFDAFLRLEDASEKELARDDDSGGGLNARIIFTAPATASYRIIATCLNRRPGNFTLSVRTD